MVAGKEMVINNVLVAMQAALNSIQLQILEAALRESMRGYRLEEECTALATSMDDNEYILHRACVPADVCDAFGRQRLPAGGDTGADGPCGRRDDKKALRCHKHC